MLVRRPNFAALATATEDLWDPVARAYLDPAGRWYWRDPKLPDVEAAADQHAGLVAALRAEDVEVVEAPDLPDELTSSVFTRDPLVTVPGRDHRPARAPDAPRRGALDSAFAEGVDIVPVDYDEILKKGGGIHCSTMELVRDY